MANIKKETTSRALVALWLNTTSDTIHIFVVEIVLVETILLLWLTENMILRVDSFLILHFIYPKILLQSS